MSQINFIDTTLRDGQQSLWALNMKTEMMLPALKQMDEAGFEAMEFFVPIVQLKKMIRDLNENPWEWLRQGAAVARKNLNPRPIPGCLCKRCSRPISPPQ